VDPDLARRLSTPWNVAVLETPQVGWSPLLAVAFDELRRTRGGGLLLDVERWSRFLELVVRWNKTHDLTAARSAEELVDLYLADAYVVAAATESGSWVDVGAGGGAPGVGVALFSGAGSILMIEPRAKRVAFLRTVIGSLELGKFARARKARSNEIEGGVAEVALSRATFSPDHWLPEGARLARRDVWVLLAHGAVPATEAWRVAADFEYRWPLTGVARRAVRFERAASK
jgi:16S rRNA (guanine527-N7)-methyltransferase